MPGFVSKNNFCANIHISKKTTTFTGSYDSPINPSDGCPLEMHIEHHIQKKIGCGTVDWDAILKKIYDAQKKLAHKLCLELEQIAIMAKSGSIMTVFDVVTLHMDTLIGQLNIDNENQNIIDTVTKHSVDIDFAMLSLKRIDHCVTKFAEIVEYIINVENTIKNSLSLAMNAVSDPHKSALGVVLDEFDVNFTSAIETHATTSQIFGILYDVENNPAALCDYMKECSDGIIFCVSEQRRGSKSANFNLHDNFVINFEHDCCCSNDDEKKNILSDKVSFRITCINKILCNIAYTLEVPYRQCFYSCTPFYVMPSSSVCEMHGDCDANDSNNFLFPVITVDFT